MVEWMSEKWYWWNIGLEYGTGIKSWNFVQSYGEKIIWYLGNKPKWIGDIFFLPTEQAK